jgi:hypothetical protein
MSNSQRDQEIYGTELLDAVGRKSLEAVAPHIHRLQNENEQLQRRLAQQAAASIHEKLDRELPNWREINNDPGFLHWLSIPSPYSGQAKSQLIRNAFAAGDANRVLVFFRDYLAQEGATSQPHFAQSQGRWQQPQQNTAGAVTNADITAFYDRCRKGVYAGKDAERNAEEARLHKAINSGQFRGRYQSE